MLNVITKIFGSKHDRDRKAIQPIVDEINTLYVQYHSLSDDELRGKTTDFKNRIQESIADIKNELSDLKRKLKSDPGDEEEAFNAEDVRDQIKELEEEEKVTIEEVLTEILPDVFAVVKQACRRLVGKSWLVSDIEVTWDMIPFDVQLIGGIVLHEGKIAEMATGEGKTLVATMPIFLNALTGKGVHLITVNDYLARRDSEWMGKIYDFLGLTTAFMSNDMIPQQRHEVYRADITYGTNNEFGFDYLRDNMAIRAEDVVQRKHNYAIIDEVDSVLIDEARTPLIISGPVEHSTQKFDEVKPTVANLVRNQTRLVNQIVSEGEKLLNEDEEYEAGIRLLQALRGAPKHKKLTKLMHEVGVKKLIRKVESDYMRDKRMNELDEDLYYAIDEKSNVIDITDKGREALSPRDPGMFILPDLSVELDRIDKDESLDDQTRQEKKTALYQEYGDKSERIHNISQLLKAYSLFEKDVEYVVSEDGKVMIVDEFTGRLMPGRRFSDGLHQALEAKEGVKIERETQTMATITLQNFFRLYSKLAGMTGTAETEAGEFWEIYKLDVVVIPTNRPIRRRDYEDEIYRTKREKYNAVIDEIIDMHERKRPVLVGTITVEVSETLSRMLKRRGIKHSVLNAKYHLEEAKIVANAGQPGMVTIATNMAGRGTDIKLGKGVVHCDGGCHLIENNGRDVPADIDLTECSANMPCGLHIIGTERHESRRIDRQLRGRSGRQGDPGSSRFYLSLEDDLMRLFGSDRIANVMDRMGLKEGEVIKHPMITRSIERAQKRVETHNFDIRKHLLEYDNVMNQQREVIYNMRAHALQGDNLREEILDMIDSVIDDRIQTHAGTDYIEEWNLEGLNSDLQRMFLLEPVYRTFDEIPEGTNKDDLSDEVKKRAMQFYENKERAVTKKSMRILERLAMLQSIDKNWKEHLYEMDQMKEGINLRAYGQKDPLLEYKSEGFRMFTEMLGTIDTEVVELVFKAQIQQDVPFTYRRAPRRDMRATHDNAAGMAFSGTSAAQQTTTQSGPGGAAQQSRRAPVVADEKIGRNDPCPCGSGKKYKKCHGK
ncbi:preprotein translocase subunit SecA [candidate division KSB1 bacterium]|nr:preprotein translocase subunit SecA [candidate division KSB1 bacterium]